jgi:DedD protein
VSDGLKQRIAGTIVLGMLGLIILPLLIDFADPDKIDRTTKIPPAPSLQVNDIVKSDKPDAISVYSSLKALFDTDSSSPADDTQQAPGLNSNKLPRAWIVQVGSFVDQRKASELQRKLSSKGYPVFQKKVTVDDEPRYRVYIGPKLDKNKARAIKKEVDTLLVTDSIVLNYIP